MARRRSTSSSGSIKRLTVVLTVASAVVGLFATAAPASAAPHASPLGAPAANTTTPSQRPAPLTGLGPVSPGPDGSARPDTTTSPADTPIAPLPALDPGPDASPSVPEATVPQVLPVSPAPITLATNSGQTLVDATANDALNTMAAAGPYVSGGNPALDANKLQPQVASAQPGDPTNPATLAQLIAALQTGEIPPPLPVDPLALLQQLPNGIPQLTYRLCSESPTKPVSCSITLPLGVPALLNVTGNGTASSPDGTPDVLADLVPVAGVSNIVSAVQTLLSAQTALNAAKQSLAGLIELLKNPLYLLTHPGALLQQLNLQNLVNSLQAQVQQDIAALSTLVDVGVSLLEYRLPTSEVPNNQPLRAHVWAVYDIPGYHRLSVGFDGYRRGGALPHGLLGVFTVNPGEIAQGIYDVHADLLSSSDGTSVAITAGISSITHDSAGTAFDPTVASIKFSPMPWAFGAHAVIDPTTGTDKVDVRTSEPTQLDALVFSNQPSGDQYVQAKIDSVPHTMSATLQRSAGGTTTVNYRASDTIDSVLFADYGYAGTTLQNALQAQAFNVPASFDAGITTGGDTTVTYTASSSLSTLGLAYYDHAGAIGATTGPLVLRGALSGLPTDLYLLFDGTNKHVQMTADTRLGAAALQASYRLGAYAPLVGDHASFVKDGDAFGADARITGLKSVDAYYDTDPRVALGFDPGGQAFAAAGLIDGHQKIRADISNLPATLSAELDTVGRKFNYTASDVVDEVTAAYVDTASGPSIAARIDKIPTSVHASWDLGSAPHVHYEASSGIPLAQLFFSTQGVETVDPHGNDYVSAEITDFPATLDVLVDFANGHVEGTSSGPIGAIKAAARAPFDGREWTAVGELDDVPAHFTADFANGNYDFHAISGPLGSAALTVSNHGDPTEPTSPAHIGLHYNEVSGDIDASASIVNLTEIGYTRGDGTQHLTLQADEGANAIQLDAHVVLADPNDETVEDTELSALGSISGLPSQVDITFADGKITYSADKHIGIELGVRAGKIAALAGLGAPLPANGIAAVARTCATGDGCATDDSPFCSAFPRCVGAVANINMSGLPTSVVVDTTVGTVAFTGYQPPVSSLTLYVRLIGLIGTLPDVSARATLSGLPASLDFTAGPFTFGTGDPAAIDASYHASAPLGSLSVDVNATTTNATFPLLRANATITGLPADLHVIGSFGGDSHVTVDDSAAIPNLSATVTNATAGYLQASIDNVPKTMTFDVNVPSRHAEATMSSAIDAISVVAHVPYDGRTWNAFAQMTNVPGHFTADFGNGAFGFKALSGPLGSATFAVSNHTGATVPVTTRYLAAHYDELTGDVDAGASVGQLTDVEYAKSANGDQTFGLDMGAATVGLDADIELAKNGARDTVFSAGGTITTPNSVHVDISNGHIVYRSDQSAALNLSAAVGKKAALAGLGAPLYPQGIGVRARGCATGPGCAHDASIFCSVFSSCFGAVANVSLPGLPTKVDIDTEGGTVDIEGLHPSGDLKVFAELDGLISALPKVRALATLSGLPSTLNIKVGPFGTDPADPTKVVAGYQASAGLGRLQVDADADTTSSFGTVRGQLIADGLPATFSVNGKFGSSTHIHVGNSAGIDDLRVQATATLQGSPGSGLIDFTDVPATMDLDVGSAGTAQGVNVPTFTYSSPDSTLDGMAQLDANLTQNVGPAGVGTDGAYFRFTNLGGDTKVRLDPSTFTLTMTSTPATDSFQAGANLHIDDMPNQDFSKQVFDVVATQGYVEGHYGVRPSKIDDIELDIENMSSLKLQPGKAPFGLPTEVGLLFPGVSGDYGTFSLQMYGVDLHPDVSVTFRVNDPFGDDSHPFGTITLPTTINDLVFHRFDSNGPKTFAQINLLVVCVSFKVNPEDVGKSSNGVTLHGSDGPQSFNYFDINDIVPDILVSLIGAYTSPFMDIDISTDGDLGPC